MNVFPIRRGANNGACRPSVIYAGNLSDTDIVRDWIVAGDSGG